MGGERRKGYDEARRERMKMVNWLRNNRYAAGLLVLVRLYLGWKWLDAGWHKLTADKAFDASGFLTNAVNKPVLETGTKNALYPHYVDFLQHIALPNVKLFNFLIPWGETLVGLGLILGALTTAAAFFGVLMNFMFLLAGTVSSNPWLLLFGAIVLFAGANAGKFGSDYYLLPLLKRAVAKGFRRNRTHNRPVDPNGLPHTN